MGGRDVNARARLAGTIGRSAGALGLALALLGAPPTARAVEAPATAPEEGPKLGVDFMLYGWIPGVYGTVHVRDTTVKIDTTPIDLLELLWHGDTFGGAGYLALDYDR